MNRVLKIILPDNSSMPRWVILVIDLTICAVSYTFATLLRFNFFLEDKVTFVFFYPLPLVIAIRAAAIIYFKIYAGVIRHTSLQDAVRVFYTTLISTLVIGAINIAYIKYYHDQKVLIPISIIIIDFLGTTMLMNVFRMATKILFLKVHKPTVTNPTYYAIFGTGEIGVLVHNKLKEFSNGRIIVKAFFDDNPRRAGQFLDGIKIFDGNLELYETLKNIHIDELVISDEHLTKTRKQEIIEACLNANVIVRSVPTVDKWINGELSINQIRSVKIDDLIERDEIVLDKGAIAQKLFNKTILITGAAGSIGSEIARQIITHFNPKKLILLDKSEVQLYELDAEFSANYPNKKGQIRMLIGDITDKFRMRHIFSTYRPEFVFHAAAYKHVPLMEMNATETVRVNIQGTKILADLAVEFHVSKFVYISTDKAVNPTNVMGASKRIAEVYVQALDNFLERTVVNRTRFITTRFGNVIGSSGSVIPKFRKQIESGGPVTVTHPEVTRYFMSIPEACQLVLEAGNMGNGGEIYIFDMGKSMKIINIAKRMIQLSGLKLGEDIQIIFTGLRPGEKLVEELLSDHENTLPTYHPKIMIARVRMYDFKWVNTQIQDLVALNEFQNNQMIVLKMKEMLPEFISQNSVFEGLDFSQNLPKEAEKHSHMD